MMRRMQGHVRRVTRDINHLRNAPHLNGVPALRCGPRLAGYGTATGIALTGAGLGRAAGDIAYNIISGFIHAFYGALPFQPVGDSIENVASLLVPAGFVAGAAVGVRAGTAAGRWVADQYTRNFEQRADVEARVRSHYRSMGARGTHLNTEVTAYLHGFYR
ncbi:MAG: hypothetical protein HY365_03125 [Candidatus Aenigmarchaeota archaeon]|nr:hypothetical protein [Candidatus Aenigmarchaeota archaeon]